ncbi:MAG: PEP-CTERM sorting domain-containing protein [Cyanobacteria bacterium P01_C01_bin.118]
MVYKVFALSTLAALAPVLPGHQALASDTSLSLFGETTIGGITAKVTSGVNPDGTGTSGTFSEFYDDNTVTIDFNAAPTPLGENRYTFGTDLITYTFEQELGAALSKTTGVYNERWAPTGANGEKNTSNYLAVFQGNSVTIDLDTELNYFGINWGALSKGNNFTFLKDGTPLSTFTTKDINPIAAVKATHQKNEGNGYVHFYTSTTGSSFDQISISQTSNGGFETDNHSFRIGDEPFDFDENLPAPETVPEPTTLISLAVIGGLVFSRKRLRA